MRQEVRDVGVRRVDYVVACHISFWCANGPAMIRSTQAGDWGDGGDRSARMQAERERRGLLAGDII